MNREGIRNVTLVKMESIFRTLSLSCWAVIQSVWEEEMLTVRVPRSDWVYRQMYSHHSTLGPLLAEIQQDGKSLQVQVRVDETYKEPAKIGT